MEYTKVQTALNHVKDAITTKLDAIKTDVTSVNNSVTNLPTTLDSKFSALTSKVDGVKTDVAGVGSKVDAGVTTLGGKVDAGVTTLCGKVDGVKSDIAKTAKSTELSNLKESIIANDSFAVDSPDDIIAKNFSNVSISSKEIKIFSIVGKGKVNLLEFSQIIGMCARLVVDNKEIVISPYDSDFGGGAPLYIASKSSVTFLGQYAYIIYGYDGGMPEYKVLNLDYLYMKQLTPFERFMSKNLITRMDSNGYLSVVKPSLSFNNKFELYVSYSKGTYSMGGNVYYTLNE